MAMALEAAAARWRTGMYKERGAGPRPAFGRRSTTSSGPRPTISALRRSSVRADSAAFTRAPSAHSTPKGTASPSPSSASTSRVSSYLVAYGHYSITRHLKSMNLGLLRIEMMITVLVW